MHTFITIKYHEDQQNRPHIERLVAALEAVGFTTTCIVRDLEVWGQQTFGPAPLMQRTFAEISRSDLVIVDFAEQGVGVGIEAGYAYAKGLPVIVLAPNGIEISNTLAGIATRVYRYSDDASLNACCARLAAEFAPQTTCSGPKDG